MTPSEIKRRRVALGYSVRGFAKALECSPSTVSRWESGEIVPQPMRLLEFAFNWMENEKSKSRTEKRLRHKIADLFRRDFDMDERVQVRDAIEIIETGRTWRDKE